MENLGVKAWLTDPVLSGKALLCKFAHHDSLRFLIHWRISNMARSYISLFGLLFGLCFSTQTLAQDFAPNGLRIYPSNPTTGDQVYIIVNYPCPYPSRAPLKIQRVNGQVLVELAT